MHSTLWAGLTACLAFTSGVTRVAAEGTLVIVGGGTIPADVRAEFFALAGGQARARLVLLPGASLAADDPGQQAAFLQPWRELRPVSVQLLHTRDRHVADDPAFVHPLLDASAVWISGGDQNRLIADYRGTLLERELHRLYQRGGVIGGTSAGAAVMSDVMIAGGNPEARTGPGFGWLNGYVVDQHFVARQRIGRLRGVLAEYPAHAGLGVDEGTAAIIRGQTLTIRGASTVTVIWPRSSSQPAQERTFKTGEVLDLADLRASTNQPPTAERD